MSLVKYQLPGRQRGRLMKTGAGDALQPDHKSSGSFRTTGKRSRKRRDALRQSDRRSRSSSAVRQAAIMTDDESKRKSSSRSRRGSLTLQARGAQTGRSKVEDADRLFAGDIAGDGSSTSKFGRRACLSKVLEPDTPSLTQADRHRPEHAGGVPAGSELPVRRRAAGDDGVMSDLTSGGGLSPPNWLRRCAGAGLLRRG